MAIWLQFVVSLYIKYQYWNLQWYIHRVTFHQLFPEQIGIGICGGGGGKGQSTLIKNLRVRTRTDNNINSKMTRRLGFEPSPHWWEVSGLILCHTFSLAHVQSHWTGNFENFTLSNCSSLTRQMNGCEEMVRIP